MMICEATVRPMEGAAEIQGLFISKEVCVSVSEYHGFPILLNVTVSAF